MNRWAKQATEVSEGLNLIADNNERAANAIAEGKSFEEFFASLPEANRAAALNPQGSYLRAKLRSEA